MSLPTPTGTWRSCIWPSATASWILLSAVEPWRKRAWQVRSERVKSEKQEVKGERVKGSEDGERMIPLVDLKKQARQLEGEILRAIGEVLADCNYVRGVWIEEFEKAFACFCETAAAAAVSSGTAALHLGLLAADVGAGDEVVTTPFTFIATAEAITAAGARPVFADIRPGSFTVDPEKIEGVVTRRTKSIVPAD